MRVHYLSTRGSSPPVSFQKAVFRGIAPDGGLYLPDHIPVLARESIFDLTGRSLPDIGARLLAEFVAPDLEGSAFEGIVREAFDFPVPLIRLEEDLYVAFHGPGHGGTSGTSRRGGGWERRRRSHDPHRHLG
jgi:threonine synthase